MARKTRRQKQRSATRQAAPARAPGARADEPNASPAASLAVTDALDAELDAEIKADEDAVADEVGEDDSPSAPAPIGDTPPRDPEFPRSAIAATTPATAGPPTTASPRRRIERLSQATPVAARAGRPGRGPSNAAALFQPLETEDAAIPFDRVPYVPADLRRVAVIALMMVGLIIVAAIVVTHVVH